LPKLQERIARSSILQQGNVDAALGVAPCVRRNPRGRWRAISVERVRALLSGMYGDHSIAPVRRRRSFQFGGASAPIIPHAVHTMRGENAGTDMSSGQASTLMRRVAAVALACAAAYFSVGGLRQCGAARLYHPWFLPGFMLDKTSQRERIEPPREPCVATRHGNATQPWPI